jgi:hypothetical protein
MDPWWNPAAEHQAMDRTHRLGQFKPIRATRFVIANTIEDRILKLQVRYIYIYIYQHVFLYRTNALFSACMHVSQRIIFYGRKGS